MDTGATVGEVTRLLRAWQDGDAQALDRLLALLYDELRVLARRQLARLAPGQTLDTGAVLHEGYLRIAGASLVLNDRRHFMALMARVMRHVLLDHVQANQAQRRGGDLRRVEFSEALTVPDRDNGASLDIVDLDRAMAALGELEPRKEQIVEMYYFGGMTRPEIAEALELSLATVDRDLRFAAAWLRTRLER